MTHFLKLQATSILLALVILINIQLLANSGRLSLWIGDAYVPVIAVIGLTSLGVFARVTIRQIVQLTPTLWNLSLYLLWLPYLALFTFGWTRVIPAPNEAAWPTPAVGLVIIALVLTFPLYIFIIHMIARFKQQTT
ncbi:hypothetical protein [Exiguobacterium mexicanum]|uniref:hypothetical protein n=1 Tax=Exiguobacterium mexicanum TaxID=340146 RepID=UPI0037C166AF